MKKNLIEIGSCTKPHGIKGGVTLKLFNEDSRTLKAGSNLVIKSLRDEKESFLEVESINYAAKTICYFKGINDRTKIEELLPFSIWIGRDEFEEESEGEFYLVDLIGLEVFDEEELLIGNVDSFYDNGAQEIMVIKSKNTTFDLPFVDAFIKDVDLKEKKIVIIRPEYIS